MYSTVIHNNQKNPFHMRISFIHMQILVCIRVNKTNVHMKDFTLGLALKQKQKATDQSLMLLVLVEWIEFNIVLQE